MKILITEYYWWVPDVVKEGKFKTFINKIVRPDNMKKTGKKELSVQLGEIKMEKGNVIFSIDQITKNGVRITAGKGSKDEKVATVTDKRDFVFEVKSGDGGYRYEISVFEE